MGFRAIVRGRVQGVGFRRLTKKIADREGITGSVRNLQDGTVEVLSESRANLEKLIQEVENQLSLGSFIVNLNVYDGPIHNDGFRIL